MNQGRASIAVMAQRGVPAAIATVALLSGCDGPHAKAGKQADAAAGIKTGPLTKGLNERLGAIQDRTERDRTRAIDAQADAGRGSRQRSSQRGRYAGRRVRPTGGRDPKGREASGKYPRSADRCNLR